MSRYVMEFGSLFALVLNFKAPFENSPIFDINLRWPDFFRHFPFSRCSPDGEQTVRPHLKSIALHER